MGEFDIDRIVEFLDSGEFLWTDLCWSQGMAGWGPLSNLRAEVAAAKSFPPVAAMPVSVAPGRRRMQPPPAPLAATQATAPRFPGWAWIVGGVSLGGVVGLLVAQFYPNVVFVERPVERIVERPVEVVRVIEKRVEVPAALTKQQEEAIAQAAERQDALKRDVGIGATAMIPVIAKKVKIFVNMDDNLKQSVSQSAIKARVEGAFRRNGFVVVEGSGEENFANTLIFAEIFRADDKSSDRIEGVVRLKVSQYYLASGAFVQKLAWFDVKTYENALRFPESSFHKIPTIFEDFAVEATMDLTRAGKLPYRQDGK